MPSPNPIAVTGLGVVSPIGNGIPAFWKAAVAGASGTTTIDRFDPSQFRCQVAGQVRGLEQSPFYRNAWASLDYSTRMALVAASEALTHAGITPSKEGYPDYGIVVGTGIGGVETHEAECRKFVLDESARMHPTVILRVMCNANTAHIAAEFGFAGPSATIVTACASSLQAIGEGCAAIRRQDAKLVVAGGTEAPLSKPLFATWNSMRVLSKWPGDPSGACRPFSADRSGLVLAEGAAFLVLEDPEHARLRGAQPIGFIHGYATNTTHNHLTKPSLAHEVVAIRSALRHAGISADEVVYIYAHGTGTKTNDVIETRAIKEVFSQKSGTIQVSSGKSQYGHTLGAAGAFGCVTGLLALKEGIAPPTINLEYPDPDCDLNYVPNEAQPLRQDGYTVINAFGFGGNNAVMVVGPA